MMVWNIIYKKNFFFIFTSGRFCLTQRSVRESGRKNGRKLNAQAKDALWVNNGFTSMFLSISIIVDAHAVDKN